MGERKKIFKAITSPSIRGLLDEANRLSIKKEDVIQIFTTQTKEYALVYSELLF